MDVLKQVPHRCAEGFSVVVTEERGMPEHLKGDEAMQVSPRDQQERGHWGRQISQAVMRQLVQIGPWMQAVHWVAGAGLYRPQRHGRTGRAVSGR